MVPFKARPPKAEEPEKQFANYETKLTRPFLFRLNIKQLGPPIYVDDGSPRKI